MYKHPLISVENLEEEFRYVYELINQYVQGKDYGEGFYKYRLAEFKKSIDRTVNTLSGFNLLHGKLYKIISETREQLLNNIMDNLLDHLKNDFGYYDLHGGHGEDSSSWQQMLYLINHEYYYPEGDFLFSISRESVDCTAVYWDTDFSDVGENQREFAKQIFSAIKSQTDKLNLNEITIIWSLSYEGEGREWLYSEDPDDNYPEWEASFIDNYVYSLLLEKAQSTPLTDNVVSIE